MFFVIVQNKLHYVVHENTAAEVVYNRVDNEKPFCRHDELQRQLCDLVAPSRKES